MVLWVCLVCLGDCILVIIFGVKGGERSFCYVFFCVSKVFGRRAFISISVVMCRYIVVTQGHGTRPLYAGYRRLCEVRRSRMFAAEARGRLGAGGRGSHCGSID